MRASVKCGRYKSLFSFLKDLASLSEAIVCVESGSAQESILEQFCGFTIKKLEPSASILETKYGKDTAVLLEYSLFADFKSKYPELIAVNIALDDQNKIMGNGIGITKNNKELKSQIEQIVSDLKSMGFIQKCENLWLKPKQVQT